jgi:hypothetical protein
MHTLLSARRLLLAPLAVLTLATACTGGDDNTGSGFGSISLSQGSQPTQPTADPTVEPTSSGSMSSSGDTGSTQGIDSSSSSSSSDPSTTSTTTTDPSTTTTNPSTTTTDPSTTTTDPSTTTTTTDPSTTTGDPPPPKDPQPVDNLYESCLDNTPCNAATTDGCFTITDAMTMKVIDGYCTLLCNSVVDCGVAPKAPAVQECLTINLNPMQKVCALKCNGVADCPTGMACTALALPNNNMGSYCT